MKRTACADMPVWATWTQILAAHTWSSHGDCKCGRCPTLPAAEGTGLASERGRFVRLERCESIDPDLDLLTWRSCLLGAGGKPGLPAKLSKAMRP